jgi:hypothetical protein
MLPIWIDDDGTTRFDVPKELSELRIAEILLIQRVAPLVPLHHIRNGTLGIKGHVCSFVQDISEVATVLPRLPSNVKAVKMIRTYTGSDGKPTTKTFVINRKRVLRALRWLIRYHRDYRTAYENGELRIDETNLDWMGDLDEAELPSVATVERVFADSAEADGSDEGGVSNAQSISPETTATDEMECSGITCGGEAALTSEAHDSLIRSLQAAASKNKVSVLDWPQTSSEALSEYDDSMKIFTNAFPHLFPGGIADANERERTIAVTPQDWAKHLLFYKDGRFAKDPIWCFFAYNYVQRRQNVSGGNYFVNSHISNPPRSLEQLQNQLRDGDTSFINKISFYTKRVRGSDAYWRFKRSQLYAWINHHVGNGNGAPQLFKTLSCAEYFWPDMIRLLEDRVWIAEGKHLSQLGEKLYRDGKKIELTNDSTARNKAVNDYSIVVQEFFIERLRDWLTTVGKEIFGIRHYWCRLEFAKGRGQIHAHLLAIVQNEKLKRLQYQLNNPKITPQHEADLITEWAEDTLGMSASLPNNTMTNESE